MAEQQVPATTKSYAPPNPSRVALHHLLLAGVLAATFVVYIGTLGFDFVYDDHELLEQNFRIQSWRYAPSYFTQHLWSHIFATDPINFYRPVLLLWFRFNHMFFGLKPAGWHLTTVLVHAVVTLLVYLLANRLLGNRFDACVAALIFGLHPVHLEAVAWVSGVAEPLMAMWFISSFICYLKWNQKSTKAWLWIFASLAFYVLAMLTKESALVLPAVVFAWEWIVQSGKEKSSFSKLGTQQVLRATASAAPYLALSVVCLVVRLMVLKRLSYAFTALPLRTILITVPSVVWFYLKLLIWPVGLSEFYETPYVTHPGLFNFVLPIAMVTAFGAGLVWWSRRSPNAAFASIWLFLPIPLVLNFRVFGAGDIVHDRYLYLPSVGFSIMAAMALRHLKMGRAELLGRPAAQVVAVVALALLLGLGTVYQSLPWANDLLLAYRGTRIAPHSFYALNDLANAMAKRGYNDEAIRLYQKALELRPEYWDPRYNLGLLYYKIGNFGEAERHLSQAIQMNPDDPRGFVCLGLTEWRKGHASEAAVLIKRAIQIQPQDSSTHVALGVVLKSQGDLEDALKEFQIALSKEPGSTSARQQIAEVEAQIKKSQNDQNRRPTSICSQP